MHDKYPNPALIASPPSPDNRAGSRHCEECRALSVATTKQSHANMNFSRGGQAKEGDPLPPATDFPPASEIDFTNPNALYDLVMKQQKESEEEFQLFSIGEAIYKMPVNKNKKKR